jgi:hypothetical protein
MELFLWDLIQLNKILLPIGSLKIHGEQNGDNQALCE